MIILAVVGLLFIAMIVFAVLSARKDWHWFNPVLLVFIFIAGVVGIAAMSQTLQLRLAAIKALEGATKRLARAETERQMVIFGDLKSSTYGPNSLRGLNQQLELLQLGRGRVWLGGKVANQNGKVTFTFSAAQPEVDENLSLVNTELFAFAVDSEGQPSFVGKVGILQQTPTELVMEQAIPIADWQEFGEPQAASWTLYERMPFDKHGIFRELHDHAFPDKSLIDGDQFDITQFRKFLTSYPAALPADKMGMDSGSADYERLIDELAFDGLTFGEIDTWVESAPNRVAARFEPDPSEVFVRYRFTGESKEAYIVDDKTGKLDTDGTFSIQGHAVDPLLHLSPGEETRDVSFKKDDIVEIDLTTAEGYQRPDGTSVAPFTEREPNVEVVGRIFRRKLVDFPYEMTNLYNRGNQSEAETARLVSNNEVQDTALKDLLKQQQERTRSKVAYDNDSKLLQNDLDNIQAVLQKRELQVSENARKIESLKLEMERLRASIEVSSRSFGSSR